MLDPTIVTLIHFHDFQKEETVFRANKHFRGCVFADPGSTDLVMPFQGCQCVVEPWGTVSTLDMPLKQMAMHK